MLLNELIGKKIIGVRALPTITTALQSEQDVETWVVELEGGSTLTVTSAEDKGQGDSLALDIKIK